MKILFLGDYSNLHACLATELRRRGHTVTVVSDGCRYLDTECDINITREPGLRGSLSYLYRLFSVMPGLRGYDVVQLINPQFLDLRPGRNKYFLDMLRRNNGSLFCTLAGNDNAFVEACVSGDMFRFSEFMTGRTSTPYNRGGVAGSLWTTEEMHAYREYVYSHLDGAMSVLPEYDMASRPLLGDRLAFTNIPVDLSTLPFSELTTDGPLRLFVGIRRESALQKGTGVLLEAAQAVAGRHPGEVEVDCVSNVSLKEYLERMRGAHVVLDQLYSALAGHQRAPGDGHGKSGCLGSPAGILQLYRRGDAPRGGAVAAARHGGHTRATARGAGSPSAHGPAGTRHCGAAQRPEGGGYKIRGPLEENT